MTVVLTHDVATEQSIQRWWPLRSVTWTLVYIVSIAIIFIKKAIVMLITQMSWYLGIWTSYLFLICLLVIPSTVFTLLFRGNLASPYGLLMCSFLKPFNAKCVYCDALFPVSFDNKPRTKWNKIQEIIALWDQLTQARSFLNLGKDDNVMRGQRVFENSRI